MGMHIIPSENALQTTLDTELSAGETSTMTLSDDWSTQLSGVSSTNKAVLVIDRVDTNGTNTPTKREYIEFTGVSGQNITGLTRGKGGSSDQVHSVGAVVELVTDVDTLRSIKTTFEIEHNADGTHNLASTDLSDTADLTYNADTDVSGNGWVIDEDTMASDLATKVPTQQSVKAYVDSNSGGGAKILFSPLSAVFPASNYPQLVKNTGTNKTDFTLDYDASTDETAEFEFLVPNGLTTPTATLYITYRMASATSGDVIWASITNSIADGEAWDAAGTTDTFTADTVPGTAGMVAVVSKALTTTGWAADETLHIKISRDADNAGDTATGDAKLMSALLVIA